MSAPSIVRRRRRLVNGPLHVVGLSLIAISMATAAGLVVEVIYGDEEWATLGACTGVFAGGGSLLWFGTALPTGGSSTKRAAQSVGVAWVAISVAGAAPYVVAGMLPADLALFESISGLTGTGATVLSPIEGNTRGMLFYRQMTQLVGGLGILVLAVAILPFLGVGGMELFRAESTGPESSQLVPRISETARRLWTVYVVLTLASAVLFAAVGMTVYDALAHAVTSSSTGGFSPYDASIGHFDSVAVEVAAIAAMFLGAVKFPLFYTAVRRRTLALFWRTSEFRFFVLVLTLFIPLASLVNLGDGSSVADAVREGAFNVTSIGTSTGFGTTDFAAWAPAGQLLLLFLMVSGAMAGSTSGGVKLFRIQVVLAHAWREVRRVRRPSAVLPVRLGSEPVPEDTVRSVLGYVMLYVMIGVAGIVVITMFGSDLTTAAGAVMSALGATGPGLGEAGPTSNFLVFDAAQRGVLMVLMLLGRLEIFPLVLFLVPVVAAGRRSVKRAVPRGALSSRAGGRDREG